MLLHNVSRDDLAAKSMSSGSEDVDDYTGTTPSVIKIHDVDDHEQIMESQGQARTYFVKEGDQSGLVQPQKIPDTDLYLETNLSARDCIRRIREVMEKYGYDVAELEIPTEDG